MSERKKIKYAIGKYMSDVTGQAKNWVIVLPIFDHYFIKIWTKTNNNSFDYHNVWNIVDLYTSKSYNKHIYLKVIR